MKGAGKTVFATTLVVGFLLLTALVIFYEIPKENVKTVDGAMVALGTALGAAVMALLRNSHADDMKAENTGKALDAIGVAMNATPGSDRSETVE